MKASDRILMYLKEKGQPVSSAELSEKLGLSKSTVYYSTTILVAAEKIKRYMGLAGVFVLEEVEEKPDVRGD
jgi:DNA-binding Lrp family transcriptional regulator